MKYLRYVLGAVAMLYLIWVMMVAWQTPTNTYPSNPTPFADARFEHQTLSAPDGTAVHVALRRGAQEGAPAVLYFMGNGGSRALFAADLQALLDLPVSVVVMGYRGGEGHDGTPSEAALKTDAQVTYAALPQLLGAAPSEVHVVGYSMGAGLALDLAARHDLSSVFLKAPAVSICGLIARYTATPQCWVPGVDHWVNTRAARDVSEPVRIVYGDRDEMFSPDFADLIAQFPTVPQVSVYPDTGHNDFSATPLVTDLQSWISSGWRAAQP